MTFDEPRHRHRGRWVAATAALVVAVGGGLTWYQAGRSDPVSPSAAVTAFRAARVSTDTHGGPDAGVYRYLVVGRESGGAGPLRIGRAFPPEATLTVTGSPGGWEAELAYSRQHIEATRYVMGDAEIAITWRRTDITFAGFGRDDRRAVEGRSRLMVLPPRVGTEWSDRYRTGDINVRESSRVLREESVEVDGERIDTVVIASSSSTDGPHPGTRSETMWWSPAHRLPVRLDTTIDIGGTFPYSARSRLDLIATAPAV